MIFVFQNKLTMARCRRNVDNFLEACRRIGVDEVRISESLFHPKIPKYNVL